MTHQSLALLAQPTGRLEGMCCAWEGNLIFQVLEFIIKKNPKQPQNPQKWQQTNGTLGHTWQLNTTAYSGCTGWFVHSFFPWNKVPGSVCCSYRKISGDTCTGGDIESRLEGELVPCPLAGECVQDLLWAQGLHS